MTITIDPTNGITFPNATTISPTGLANNIAGWDYSGGNLTIGAKATFSGDDGAILDGILRDGPFRKRPIILGSVGGIAANGGNITIDLGPLNLVEGDWVEVIQAVGCVSDRTASMTDPVGWTNVRSVYSNGSSEDVSFKTYYKQMTATPDTSVTLTGSGVSTDGHAALALAIRDFEGFDGGSGNLSGASNPIPWATATIYNVTTDDDVLAIGFYGAGFNGTPTTPSNPLFEHQDLYYRSETYDAAVAVTVRRLATAGDYTGTFPDFTDFVDTGGRANRHMMMRLGYLVS